MYTQKTYWGKILWLHANDENNISCSISVGRFEMEPGQKQDLHTHYYEEQFSYIFEGTGRSTIGDGEGRTIEAGSGVHLPPGVAHQMENIGNGPLKGLLCTCPVSFFPKTSMKLAEIFHTVKGGNPCRIFRAAVELLRLKLQDVPILPYVILDAKGDILLQNIRYTDFCIQKCNPYIQPKETPCLTLSAVSGSTRKIFSEYTCPHGIILCQEKLSHKGYFLGVIRGGYNIQGREHEEKIIATHDSFINNYSGIQILLQQIGRVLLVYYSFLSVREEIEQKSRLAKKNDERGLLLAKSLRQREEALIGLHIDRHFLFNTLNAMADMALKREDKTLYNAIICLSGIFHHSTNKTSPYISLLREIKHIDDYVYLQALRLDETLPIITNIPDDLWLCYVPVDFLLPVVENAFVHGFKDHIGEKKIGIQVKRGPDARISIRIFNNGTLLKASIVKKINKQITRGDLHGLSMLFTKLKILYGDDFSMHMSVDQDWGLGVTIEIPMRFEEDI